MPVLMIRNRLLLFVFTVNISRGTVFWFSVLLFETENEVYVITVDIKKPSFFFISMCFAIEVCFFFQHLAFVNIVSFDVIKDKTLKSCSLRR